jgi:hypothetical protein
MVFAWYDYNVVTNNVFRGFTANTNMVGEHSTAENNY